MDKVQDRLFGIDWHEAFVAASWATGGFVRCSDNSVTACINTTMGGAGQQSVKIWECFLGELNFYMYGVLDKINFLQASD